MRTAAPTYREVGKRRKNGSPNQTDQGWKRKPKTGTKKEEPKDKADTIYMIQSCDQGSSGGIIQEFSRGREISFPILEANSASTEPLTIPITVQNHNIDRMYVDGGAAVNILYAHCFEKLDPSIQKQLRPTRASLVSFVGDSTSPIGQIRLLTTVGSAAHSVTAWVHFMVIRSPSLYNGIMGRPGISAIHAVPSTMHGMLKFPVNDGIVTIYSRSIQPKTPSNPGAQVAPPLSSTIPP